MAPVVTFRQQKPAKKERFQDCESKHRFTLGRHMAEDLSPPPGGNQMWSDAPITARFQILKDILQKHF